MVLLLNLPSFYDRSLPSVTVANRWDEKAGLRRDAALPSNRRARSARDKGDRELGHEVIVALP
jgi:hypothetical protein